MLLTMFNESIMLTFEIVAYMVVFCLLPIAINQIINKDNNTK